MSRVYTAPVLNNRSERGSLGLRSGGLVYVVYKNGARAWQKEIVAERDQERGLVESIGSEPAEQAKV